MKNTRDELCEDLLRLADPQEYAEAHNDHPTESGICGYRGCRLSLAEHHRLAYGLIAEMRTARQRVAELERGA